MEKLKRKQSMTNEAWITAVENIEQLVSKDESDALFRSTVEQIMESVGTKRAAFAWSGGKDSIVLAAACEAAGIDACMAAVCDLEYPAFLSWMKKNAPKKCELINTHQDIEWLAQHQDMIFPSDSATAAKWFSIVQHRAQRQYFKDRGIEIMLLGRRRADGNYVGRGGNVYTDGNGVTRYSPLSEWTHEQVLALIHYRRLPMPPIYQWKNGYLCGTHPWPARQHTSGNGWKEVYEIDRSIVEAAADLIDGAKAFLGGDRQ